MYAHMLSNIICDEFLKQVGKFQGKVTALGGTGTEKAMLLSFTVSLNKGEEGYRQRELLLYAPLNYVAVFERERFDVIPEEGLVYDEKTDDTYVKKGYKYNKGATDWKLVVYHDSCWSDAISRFLKTHEKTIITFNGPSWFKVVDVKDHKLPEDFRG